MRFCSARAVGQRDHDLVALALVEAFFLAHADHRAGIGAVAGALQRHLVHDRGAVDQPADRADVGPGQRRIIEDGAEYLALPLMQRLDHLLAAGAERLRRAIKVEAVPGLVLHLGEQDRLAPKRRRAADPIAFGKHADDLAMRMLADLPGQRPPIGLGHPILGLDELVRRDPRLERFEELGVLEVLDLGASSEVRWCTWRRCSLWRRQRSNLDDRSAERPRIAGEFGDRRGRRRCAPHARDAAAALASPVPRPRRSASRLRPRCRGRRSTPAPPPLSRSCRCRRRRRRVSASAKTIPPCAMRWPLSMSARTIIDSRQ